MTLDAHGTDIWVGKSPSYPWGRVYGGLVVAQGLRAAAKTVEDRFSVHSLHAYFIRGGTFAEPIRYEVDRIRNGRSFITRRVVARQSGGAILNMAASFQVHEEEANVQLAQLPQGIPNPDKLDVENWGTVIDNRPVLLERGSNHTRCWLRIRGEIGDDPVLHACGLAYASDDMPYASAVVDHPACPEDRDDTRFVGASLDHAIWFHRPFRADDWILHDLECHGLAGARGLVFGRLFTPDGTHVASVSQECLIRENRNYAKKT